MHIKFLSGIWPSSLAVIIATGFGWLLGYPLVGLSAALALLLGYHLYRLRHLERTLAAGGKIIVPDGDNLWARIFGGIRREQQRVRKHKERHRRLMKELRKSTNALQDGVISLNDDNEIQRFNAAAQRLIGLLPGRDRGQRLDNLVRHPDFVAFLQKKDFSQPIIIPSSLSEDGWLSLTMIAYGGGSRLLIVRDITERTQLSRMRRDFVANASHELRTPLTVITGYIDAMNGEPELDEIWGKPLAEMERQAIRMRIMLDELLALSKLEMSKHASAEKPIDIGVVLRDAIAPYDNGAEKITVRVESANQLLGEYSDIASVATNLLTNALRYSPEGSEVVIAWRDLPNGGAELSVADQGEGISPEDVPRLTERFFRVNRGRARDSGGVGLGLAIVKHALARHDAELTIASELNVGSEFRCSFPAERIVAGESAIVKAFRSSA